jgi:hypothetical protein
LIIELTIDRIVNSASLNGTEYATFDHKFDKGMVVPILKTANSGKIPDVTLTKGIDGSLGIIPAGVLDITSDVYVRYEIVVCSLPSKHQCSMLVVLVPFSARSVSPSHSVD